MSGGLVDRTALTSNYQDPGQTYDDKKTEGAIEVVASQVDDNWTEYETLKTKLVSTTNGDSGAHNVGSAPITGLNGSTVYAQLVDVKSQLNLAVAGDIPPGTIGKDKLSFPAVDGGTSNADITKTFALMISKDTRSWVATAWNASNQPTTLEIRNGATAICTLTITYNASGNVTQLVANDGVDTITWTVTWTGDKFESFTKAVT